MREGVEGDTKEGALGEVQLLLSCIPEKPLATTYSHKTPLEIHLTLHINHPRINYTIQLAILLPHEPPLPIERIAST